MLYENPQPYACPASVFDISNVDGTTGQGIIPCPGEWLWHLSKAHHRLIDIDSLAKLLCPLYQVFIDIGNESPLALG